MTKVKGSLIVAGTGLAVGHISLETASYIETADKVFFVVADAVTQCWIKEKNASAEDLYSLYKADRDRLTTYYLMTERIMEAVRSGLDVCALFYGHPGVFVFPSHEAILCAEAEGYEAKMIPAISAEDCLFADLGVDPGRAGCQSYEATDFLVFDRKIDTGCPLILWQVGVVGEIYNQRSAAAKVKVLSDVLSQTYGADHFGIVYEASPFRVVPPKLVETRLAKLAEIHLTGISTLFVPPVVKSIPNLAMIERLGIPKDFLGRGERQPSRYNVLIPRRGKESAPELASVLPLSRVGTSVG
jgi:hypothetical protein